MTDTIQITGGSDKQNAWASSIATQWLAELDRVIADNAARNDPLLSWYTDNLSTARSAMLGGFAKITAKQVIDMHTAKASPVQALIDKAAKH